MRQYLDIDDGIKRLEDAIAFYGSLRAFCKRVGVTAGNVSLMRQGTRNITGKVAIALGLKPVYAYEINLNSSDPRQAQYQNRRLKMAERNGNPIKKTRGIRV